MNRRLLFSGAVALLAFLAGGGTPAQTAESLATKLARRSVSSSRQFIVYCPDTRLRLAVTGYVETLKAGVLETLGLGDTWKYPIIVNMERPSTIAPDRPLSRLRLSETEAGPRVDLDVLIRQEDFHEVHFPQLVVRAVLLEIACQAHPPGGNREFFLPPAWLVEGIAERLQARATGREPNAALFRTMIEAGHLPKIRDFMRSDVETMDETSRKIFAACSSSLLEMLADLPNGRASLARAVRDLQSSGTDSVGLLLKNFPALGGSEESLEKWWTLGLARFSALDRFRSLNVADTDASLQPLLKIEVITDEKSGKKSTFALEDFKKFVKQRTAKAPLRQRVAMLRALLPRAHPLMQAVVEEYAGIATSLSEGKMRGIEKSLAETANLRKMIVERTDKIADYLNWFEATQMPEPSGAFDSYLRTVKELQSAPLPRRNDALSRYLDQMEREVE